MNRAFTLIELLLTLAIVALIMAAIGPAVVGSLRALEGWRAVLEPLRREAHCFTQLREDLMACPRAVGSHYRPFLLVDSELSFTSYGSPELHPRIATRSPRAQEQHISWRIEEQGDGSLALIRTVDVHLLASGEPPAPRDEVLLEDLARCSITCFSGDSEQSGYDSDSREGVLPSAVELRFAYRRGNGEAGPQQLRYIALPQVPLDRLQTRMGE